MKNGARSKRRGCLFEADELTQRTQREQRKADPVLWVLWGLCVKKKEFAYENCSTPR